MKLKTILVFVVVMIVLFLIIRHYCNHYYTKTIESIQYGIPRLPSPLTIYRNQIEQSQKEEHFSQTMQDELSTIGSYTSSQRPEPNVFNECISVCDEKMNRCIAAGNPTSCEYNYKICRQDCGWTTRQLK
jgi:hypothetical protein